jgi:hypothetical protein
MGRGTKWLTLFANINSASLPTDAADVACDFLNGVKSGYQVAQANEA